MRAQTGRLSINSKDTCPVPPDNRASLFPYTTYGKFHQINSDGLITDLIQPGFLGYVNYPFDCDMTTVSATGWQLNTINGGTVINASTGISSGTPATNQVIDLSNHPGVFSMSSGATANSGIMIRWGGNLSSGFPLRIGSQVDFVCLFISNSAHTARLGLHDSTLDSDPTNGAYFEILNGVVSARAKQGNTLTENSSIFTVTLNAWYHFRVYVDTKTRAVFNIYDMSGSLLVTSTISTNIPTGNSQQCLPRFNTFSTTATAKFLSQIDYCGFRSPVRRGSFLT